MTAVTCPIMRYHPAIVAQAAATMGLLTGGRFTLCLGAGERLNEHIVGAGWPATLIVPTNGIGTQKCPSYIRIRIPPCGGRGKYVYNESVSDRKESILPAQPSPA